MAFGGYYRIFVAIVKHVFEMNRETQRNFHRFGNSATKKGTVILPSNTCVDLSVSFQPQLNVVMVPDYLDESIKQGSAFMPPGAR